MEWLDLQEDLYIEALNFLWSFENILTDLVLHSTTWVLKDSFGIFFDFGFVFLDLITTLLHWCKCNGLIQLRFSDKINYFIRFKSSQTDLNPLLAQVPSSPILTGVNPDSSSSGIRSHTFSLLFNGTSLAALSYAVLKFFTCLPHADLLNLQGSPTISTRSLNKGLLFPLSRAMITILAFKFL